MSDSAEDYSEGEEYDYEESSSEDPHMDELNFSADCGSVLCWGDGTCGVLGTGEFSPVPTPNPTYVAGAHERVLFAKRIACGPTHSAVVTPAGRVFTWGSGTKGCLGHGDGVLKSRPMRLRAMIGFRGASAACSEGWTALLTDQGIHACGVGARDSWTPKEVMSLRGHDIVQIVAGRTHRAALSRCGEVFTWGDTRPKPMRITETGVSFVQVSCGGSFSAALTEEGRVHMWGAGAHGSLGLGDHLQRNRGCPTEVTLLTDRVAMVDCGVEHVAVATVHGHVYTWGCGLGGRLGLGDQKDRYGPERVPGLEGVVQVACGERHTVALTASGSLLRWGDNVAGGGALVPTELPLSNWRILDVRCGSHHAMAIGRPRVWSQALHRHCPKEHRTAVVTFFAVLRRCGLPSPPDDVLAVILAPP